MNRLILLCFFLCAEADTEAAIDGEEGSGGAPRKFEQREKEGVWVSEKSSQSFKFERILATYIYVLLSSNERSKRIHTLFFIHTYGIFSFSYINYTYIIFQ